MIVDPRIYGTAYTVLCVAWLAALPMVLRFSYETVNRYMMAVAGTASVVGALNIIDWRWS